MQPSRDRVDWANLKRNYARWRERGDWIRGRLWFGFEVISSHMVGDALSIAMKKRSE